MDQQPQELASLALNLNYIEPLYEEYQQKKKEAKEGWNRFFAAVDGAIPVSDALHQELRVMQLITAYRTFGHLEAKFNPIDTESHAEKKQLSLEHLGFSESDLDVPFPTCGLMEQERAPLKEIIAWLKNTYCGKIGLEYMGTENFELEEWIQKTIEPNQFRIDLDLETKKLILERLNHSELFEKFLHTKFVAQKRFSLEGGETLIPILATVIDALSESGGNEFVIGMAHRGRLNVLANILNKSRRDIFAEFEDRHLPESYQGSGDVKYHKGFASEVPTRAKKTVAITLTPNPSHLESVNAVVEGQVRAKQNSIAEGSEDAVIPILVHGDASLAGQGVVYETMQMCALEGYKTGGTVHIVINNQIGFTTLPKEGRSTEYCTDIAKTFGAPVFHVNAEDPESCIYATIIACLIRQTFHIDVFIDLNCYRKYGHNESDEPAFTQPLQYQLIRQKKSIREIYRDQLIDEGVLEKKVVLKLEDEFHQILQGEMDLQAEKSAQEESEEDALNNYETRVQLEMIKKVTEGLAKVPGGFNLHPKLAGLLQERLFMGGAQQPAKSIDWAMGEALGLGTLLLEGHNIRFAGQDSCRGTFSQRHAVLIDQLTSTPYTPLQNLSKDQGRFEIYNSYLSEYAALGFEYGYSIAAKDTLVIWEAQFGDFANGAQVVIDQYIATSEQKWDQPSDLTLFLPHGYEGQGPEHSSGRLERFLQLAAENNMFIVYPTTPAQIFHCLRRQMMCQKQRPLIVFTPKGLLRNPECVSTLEDLTKGEFQEIIDDSLTKADILVFTSGRIYYDLIEERNKAKAEGIAIIRIEQLYPLHEAKVKAVIEKYAGFKEAVFFQEEPSNMGSADFIMPRLRALLPEKLPLRLISRQRMAATATGSHTLHKKQQQEMMNALFKREKSMSSEIKIPMMGESISQATIGQIFKPSGSMVAQDEEILELETDKVNQPLYAAVAGVVSLTVKTGDSVSVGAVIGSIEPGKKEEKKESPPPPPPKEEEKPVRYKKEDFVKELEVKKAEPVQATRKPMSKLRKVIAKRLVEVKQQTAMLTTFNEVDMTSVIAIRESHKELFQKKYKVKLGFMPFFVKAAAKALQEFKEVNAYIDGDDIVYRSTIDISIAVSTEKGLIVPVLRNAGTLSFPEIETAIAEMALKAREGTLSIDDLQGGGFTITNGGVFGSLLSTPILNPPQSAILGMHTIQKRAVVVDDEIVIRPMMYLALSYDHRQIDGKEAVTFLIAIKKALEDPNLLLMDL